MSPLFEINVIDKGEGGYKSLNRLSSSNNHRNPVPFGPVGFSLFNDLLTISLLLICTLSIENAPSETKALRDRSLQE